MKNKIEQLRDLVKSEMESTKGAHDYQHVQRVEKIAFEIAKDEGADVTIVCAMALLHDIVRPEGEGDNVHSLLSKDKGVGLLKKLDFSSEDIDKIARGILSHSIHSVGGAVETLEEKVLFDADKIDALGYIGVARWFMAMGNKNISITDAAKIYVKTTDDFIKKQGGLYTKTGNALAEKKYLDALKFMRDLLLELEQ